MALYDDKWASTTHTCLQKQPNLSWVVLEISLNLVCRSGKPKLHSNLQIYVV